MKTQRLDENNAQSDRAVLKFLGSLIYLPQWSGDYLILYDYVLEAILIDESSLD